MVKWQIVQKQDLTALKRHYLRFEPYCQLNIVDMWGWRVDPIQWFQVGDTAVYRLNDYNDDSRYLTILGKESARAAIKELCLKNRREKTLTLKCVPEETVEALGRWDAIISSAEDEDNHDYIFEVDRMLAFDSPQLRNRRKKYRRFIKEHPNIKVKPLSHNQASDRKLIYRLFKKWAAQTKNEDHAKEFKALKRMLNMKGEQLVCLGFFNGRKLVGYTLNQPEPNGYYQAFSGKTDRGYSNLGLFMEYETAKYIKKRYGSKFLNLQPDQGIIGLRYYKKSLHPAKMLRAYTVVLDVNKVLAD